MLQGRTRKRGGGGLEENRCLLASDSKEPQTYSFLGSALGAPCWQEGVSPEGSCTVPGTELASGQWPLKQQQAQGRGSAVTLRYDQPSVGARGREGSLSKARVVS